MNLKGFAVVAASSLLIAGGASAATVSGDEWNSFTIKDFQLNVVVNLSNDGDNTNDVNVGVISLTNPPAEFSGQYDGLNVAGGSQGFSIEQIFQNDSTQTQVFAARTILTRGDFDRASVAISTDGGSTWTNVNNSNSIFSVAIGDQFIVRTRARDVLSPGDIDWTISAVPLPAAGWLMLAGIGGLAAMKRRKKS